MASAGLGPERFLGSQYELIDQIGSGSMGQVWRARVRSGRGNAERNRSPLAVKVLRESLADDPDVFSRFVRERAVLVGLHHAGIVQVLDTVAEGGRLAIVMEYMTGGSLAQALAKAGRLRPGVAVPLTCQVLDALAYTHGQGVLHRDIKPANVLLAAGGLDHPDAAKLGDFGIASLVDANGVHKTGLVGSPAYMAPEMFTSGLASAASDVYAAGILLYELLSGHTPFGESGGPAGIGYRQVFDDLPRLDINDDLWGVLSAMLAKDAAQRPSARQAADALRAVGGLQGVDALPASATSAGGHSAATAIGTSSQSLASATVAGGTRLKSSPPSDQPHSAKPAKRRHPWRVLIVCLAVVVTVGAVVAAGAWAGWFAGSTPTTGQAPAVIDGPTEEGGATGILPYGEDATDTYPSVTDDSPSGTPTTPGSTPPASHATSAPPSVGDQPNASASKTTTATSTSPATTTSTTSSTSATTTTSTTTSPKNVSVSVSVSPSTGTATTMFKFTVVTSAAVSKLSFQFGSVGPYSIASSGTLSPAKWDALATGSVSADQKTWTISQVVFGAGSASGTVTAYDDSGAAVGSGSFSLTVT